MNLTIANNRFRMDDLGLRKEPTDPGVCAPGSVAYRYSICLKSFHSLLAVSEISARSVGENSVIFSFRFLRFHQPTTVPFTRIAGRTIPARLKMSRICSLGRNRLSVFS